MFAQDKGGAIKGAVRADYFWGFGESAATNAGKMKQTGLMWVLIPKGYSTNHSTNATTNN
jgi:membrane-bound lytic murein transglycosylase A